MVKPYCPNKAYLHTYSWHIHTDENHLINQVACVALDGVSRVKGFGQELLQQDLALKLPNSMNAQCTHVARCHILCAHIKNHIACACHISQVRHCWEHCGTSSLQIATLTSKRRVEWCHVSTTLLLELPQHWQTLQHATSRQCTAPMRNAIPTCTVTCIPTSQITKLCNCMHSSQNTERGGHEDAYPQWPV